MHIYYLPPDSVVRFCASIIMAAHIFCVNAHTLAFTNSLLICKKGVITLKKIRVYIVCLLYKGICTTKSAQATQLCLILFTFYHLLPTLHKNEGCYRNVQLWILQTGCHGFGGSVREVNAKTFQPCTIPLLCLHLCCKLTHGITKHTPHARIKGNQWYLPAASIYHSDLEQYFTFTKYGN